MNNNIFLRQFNFERLKEDYRKESFEQVQGQEEKTVVVGLQIII